MSIIGTFNGASIVALPSWPGPRTVEFTMSDAVAVVISPFTGQSQTQQWPGADQWTGTVTLPPLTQAQADIWIGFLMELRGMANAFSIGDPMRPFVNGTGAGVPVVDSGTNVAGNQFLLTRGWPANAYGLLLPGDYIQVGLRLHRVLIRVNSDVNGRASIPVWPSMRYTPGDGLAVILKNATGLFRLAQNKRTWTVDQTRTTSISFPIMEFR